MPHVIMFYFQLKLGGDRARGITATNAARQVFEAFGRDEGSNLDRRQFVEGYLNIVF